MQEYFIYGDSLPYDRLIARMAELRDRFRKVVMEDDFSANRNYEFRLLFQKGLRLIVTGVVVLALIIYSVVWSHRDFRFGWRLSCLSPQDLAWSDFTFQPGQFGRSFGTVFRRFGHSQPRGEEKTTTEGVGSDQRCERSPDAIVPESAVVSADPIPDDRILEMHSPPFTNIPTRIWAMPLTRRACEFCDDACFIWHV